ncbi:hypothetical protein NECAME_16353 [Necator americanus]|uniref:Uncharacterized protein n=1 Tax=Necator americanus TaxID=51031 RepID=W2TX62_NECAM|nr:hypothetical protein NECAME_16353 [Necator americanus]ETN86413.1 hypothetical protein NECAME_16353 [Necator americanus]
MDNIDEEYDRLVEHLHDCAKKAESFKTIKRRLSLETLELIRQRGAARAAGNQELTSELARLCRETMKEGLKERRAEVLREAAEAGKSTRLSFIFPALNFYGVDETDQNFSAKICDRLIYWLERSRMGTIPRILRMLLVLGRPVGYSSNKIFFVDLSSKILQQEIQNNPGGQSDKKKAMSLNKQLHDLAVGTPCHCQRRSQCTTGMPGMNLTISFVSNYRITTVNSLRQVIRRNKADMADDAGKSLDLMRRIFQNEITKELQQIMDRHIRTTFSPAIENLKKNGHDEELSSLDLSPFTMHEVLKWSPERHLLTTRYIPAAKVAALLSIPVTVFFSKYPRMFRYSCDEEDRAQLTEEKKLSRGVGRCYLMVMDDVTELLGRSPDLEFSSFVLNEHILLKMRSRTVPVFERLKARLPPSAFTFSQ